MMTLDLQTIVALVLALIAGFFGIKSTLAARKAKEATKRAEAAEDKANQAEYRETHTRDAVRAMEKELNKPLPKPAADRSDFEKGL